MPVAGRPQLPPEINFQQNTAHVTKIQVYPKLEEFSSISKTTAPTASRPLPIDRARDPTPDTPKIIQIRSILLDNERKNKILPEFLRKSTYNKFREL